MKYFICILSYILLLYSLLHADEATLADPVGNSNNLNTSLSANSASIDIASSQKGAMISNAIYDPANSNNTGWKAIEDNSGGKYYAMIGLDKLRKIIPMTKVTDNN